MSLQLKAHHMGEALRPPRRFPGVAYEDIPYDGFNIFVGLFRHASDCLLV